MDENPRGWLILRLIYMLLYYFGIIIVGCCSSVEIEHQQADVWIGVGMDSALFGAGGLWPEWQYRPPSNYLPSASDVLDCLLCSISNRQYWPPGSLASSESLPQCFTWQFLIKPVTDPWLLRKVWDILGWCSGFILPYWALVFFFYTICMNQEYKNNT